MNSAGGGICRRGRAFCPPAEQAAAQRLLNALSVTEGYAFWGGYDGAQRRQLWFLPEWQEAPEEDAVRWSGPRFMRRTP